MWWKLSRNFSEVMARVAYQRQRIVIERKGRPMMALIGVEDLRRLEALEQGTAETGRDERRHWQQRLPRAAIQRSGGGIPLPDSGDTLAQLREERADEPPDLR